MNTASILLISGPSGCGKSTMLEYIYKHISQYYFSISTTTRAQRVGEVDGVDYFFVSKEHFEKDIQNGHFLEWAKVHDNYYGTSKKPITQAINDGKLIIFDIDVQGFHILKESMGRYITSVFITTKSKSDLENRLIKRAKDSPQDIQTRLANAAIEMKQAHEYDYIIINDDLEQSSKNLLNIISVMDLKTSDTKHKKLIHSWVN